MITLKLIKEIIIVITVIIGIFLFSLFAQLGFHLYEWGEPVPVIHVDDDIKGVWIENNNTR